MRITYYPERVNQKQHQYSNSKRVSKIKDKQSRSDEKNILEKGVSPIVCDCNNTQRDEYFLPKPAFFWKNNEIDEPDVSDSAANQRWPLRLSMFPAYRFAFHKEPRSTRCHTQEKHRYSIAWLVAHVPNRLVRLLWSFLVRHPNSKHNVCLDLPRLGRRFRFFLADKCVQLVQFSFVYFRGHGSIRQLGCVATDPVNYALRVDLQDPSNWAITAAFHIHANCQ